MNPRLRQLIGDLETRPPADLERLRTGAADAGVNLPPDYLEFMTATNGASGDVGSKWIEFWPVDEILQAADAEPPYDEELEQFGGTFVGGNAERFGLRGRFPTRRIRMDMRP